MTTQLAKAQNLKEVYRLFEPGRYLETPEELASFYVNRDILLHNSILMALEENLETGRPVQMFFTGHRGCGKSTEIKKLRLELDEQFFVVPVTFKNRFDVDYIEVVLKAANSLFKAATDEAVIKKVPAQISSDFWQMMTHFIENKIYGTYLPDFSELDPQTQIKLKEVTTKINLLAIEFESRFEVSPESRNNFKDNSHLLLSEVIDKINMLSEKVLKTYGKPVLFIFEDLDKIDLKNSEELFYKHANALVSIRVCSIYVIDIALRYNAEFVKAKSAINKEFLLPNIKLLSRDNQTKPENFKLLEKFIDNRAETHLFGEGAKNLLIASSGGLIRSLISLVQTAAMRARVEGVEKIEKSHVEHAINKMRGDFIVMLSQPYYELLKEKHDSKELDKEAMTQYLLQSLSLLEYENGEIWCDVHPVILPEVEKRTATA